MTRATANIARLLIAVVLSSAVGPLSADEWTRFRGPNGTGIADDPTIPVQLAEPQNVAWKVELPGNGNSSPIVSQGRVFLQTASADGRARLMLCLDLRTGRALWSQPAAGKTAKTHQKNTLASCTAATDGNQVYMPFWDGSDLSITAFDFDGHRVWTRKLGPIATDHGPGHSPIVCDGKVILANDQDNVSELVALDCATGAPVWTTSRPLFRSCYSTPILLERPGGAADVMVVSTAGVAGYDPQTGAELWKWDWTGNATEQLRTVASPIVSDGVVFFTSGNGPGNRHAVAIRLGEKRELSQAELVWSARRTFPYVPCLLARGDHLYFVNDEGMAGCASAKTGDIVWQTRIDGGKVTASPLLIAGNVYAFSESGTATVFSAETKFNLLATAELQEGVMATPAVADGRLIVRGARHLYCYAPPAADAPTGSQAAADEAP
ncbi:MAG: outer membrane protein assembly factor BamB family protein [Planctomycetaceae bacterium]